MGSRRDASPLWYLYAQPLWMSREMSEWGVPRDCMTVQEFASQLAPQSHMRYISISNESGEPVFRPKKSNDDGAPLGRSVITSRTPPALRLLAGFSTDTIHASMESRVKRSSLAKSSSRCFAPDVQTTNFGRCSLYHQAHVFVKILDYSRSHRLDQSATSRT